MANNSCTSDTIKEYYLSYHRNCYFLELNQVVLDRTSEVEKRAKFLEKHLKFLHEKEQIDKELNRFEELKKIDLQCKKYLNSDINITRKSSVTNYIKDTISLVNGPRLDHAVWSRNLVEVMILFLGVCTPELSRLLALISIINGFASYGFYAIRGGIDLGVGISHVVDKSLEQYGIDQAMRIQFQKEQRYYRVANDIALWGPVNFLTFHYLTGPGLLGLLGTGLTVALLVADTLLTYVVYRHKQAQFKAIMGSIDDVDLKEELQKIHDEQQKKLFYTMLLQVLLAASFSIFLVNTMPFILSGSIAICVLQVLFKEKDLYLDLLKTNSGSNEAFVIKAKMLINLLEHLSIPAIFLVAGLVVMPMIPGISPLLILLACCALSGFIMKVSADLAKHVENSYSNPNLR